MFKFLRTMPASEFRITLSTLCTLVRIGLVPCIVVAMIMQYWALACILFISAAITDVLDGALARWRNEHTFLGASLDPIADKFLVLSCFFTLAFMQAPLLGVPVWFVVLVLCKEVLLVAGAFSIYYRTGHLEIKPTYLGKATTVIQICFIMWLFACYFCGWVPLKTYYILLGVMLAAIIISFVHYMTIGLQQLRR
jgi:cardiolipin synthase